MELFSGQAEESAQAGNRVLRLIGSWRFSRTLAAGVRRRGDAPSPQTARR